MLTSDFGHFKSPFASSDSMHIDLAVLLTNSPSTNFQCGHHLLSEWPSFPSITLRSSRRVSSFPIASSNRRSWPLASNMKVRSQSESEGLNRLFIEDLFAKRKKMRKREERTGENVKNEEGNTNVEKGEISGKNGLNERKMREEEKTNKEDQPNENGHSNGMIAPQIINLDTIYPPEPPTRMFLQPPPKKVSFADNHGMMLTTVRLMSEPSDVPPRLRPSLLRSLLDDADQENESKKASTWVVAFIQPASEYLRFRETLETQLVALENVLVRNDKCKMVGTIKVKNVAFEKHVFVRLTDNNWLSYFDRPAIYQRSVSTNIYDTFCFDVDIPCDDDRHQRIDFCVCYRVLNRELWDSNDGRNFSLLTPTMYRKLLDESSMKQKHTQLFGTSSTTGRDAYLLDCGNWTDFASWKNLYLNGPYW